MSKSGNGRVTTAELSRQIHALTAEFRELRLTITNVAVLESRMNGYEKNYEGDIGRLERRINSWSAINSLGIVVAGIIGFFYSPRQ